jgi:UDP-N-acetyl-D-glucosamine dehydrogenase
MHLAIIGLGYVGLPLALAFTEAGDHVTGIDVDPSKPPRLLAGDSYFKHIPGSRIATAVASGRFTATTAHARVADADAVIICVPTPLDDHLLPDISYIEQTCRGIAPHLKPGVLVVLESTTWPGTTDEVVRPLIEATGKRLGVDLFLAFSPEREDPGNAHFETRTIPKLVGGCDDASRDKAVAMYQRAIKQVVPVSSARVAEMAKLFENIFRCVNIALVNELKTILDKMDIDVHEVIKAASTKPFGFMPFWPGPGLGGHCIPLDPFYFSWKAKEFGCDARFIELAGEINRAMPAYVVSKVQDCLNDHGKAVKNSRILVLGLAYKSDIDDIRESPALAVIQQLEAKGATVAYHDPHIPALHRTRDHANLTGRTHQPLSKDYDLFVLVTHHRTVTAEAILACGVPVVDSRRALPDHPLVTRA